MAKPKEGNEVSPAQETKTEKKAAVVVAEKKQPISVLNLDTNEDEKLTLILKTYSVNNELPVEQQLKAIQQHVQPATEQVKALVKYAESKSYQDAKNAAMSKGNYLTQGLRTGIVTILSTYPAFADESSKVIFDRWLAGYKAKKPSAITVLEQAKAAQAATEVDF